MGARIAVVMKGWPRLSETFIAQEILGLQQRGVAMTIVSLRDPAEGALHEMHEMVTAPVLYLPEYLGDDPGRVAAGRRAARQMPGWDAAEAAFRADLVRDNSSSRRRRFGQAAVLAAELPEGTAAFYVHYLHTPASVARYAALMTGLPYAFSAHAKDIYTTPTWDLTQKIDDAAWGTTCTAANVAVLNALATRKKVSLAYHGLDLQRFPEPPRRAAAGPLKLLTVCRAVEKKGLDDLMRAVARLSAGLDVRLEHVGGGALVPRMQALAERLRIAPRVRFLGALTQDRVIDAYRRADAFVLASRVARDGDRDGLPNVIMEAMAMGLPVVSTEVSAVPEIVTPETGILVPQRDPAALAAALARLADTGLRARLGAAGAARVRAHFSPEPGLDAIAGRLARMATLARAA